LVNVLIAIAPTIGGLGRLKVSIDGIFIGIVRRLKAEHVFAIFWDVHASAGRLM
jgi:hypothetical protein